MQTCADMRVVGPEAPMPQEGGGMGWPDVDSGDLMARFKLQVFRPVSLRYVG